MRSKVFIFLIILLIFIAGCNGPAPPQPPPQPPPPVNEPISNSFLMGINGIQESNKEGVITLSTYSDWFDKMSSNKANFMRFRLDGRSIPLEDREKPGEVDETYIDLVSDVLDEGERKGIYFMVTFFNANAGPNAACCDVSDVNCEEGFMKLIKKNWERYHYNSLALTEGDPIKFFTDPDAKAAQKEFIKAIVDKWGDNENIVVWELMNESMACKQEIVEWHDEMSAYIKTLSEKPVTTSTVGDNKSDPAILSSLWGLNNLNITQKHVYDSTDMGKDLYNYCTSMRQEHQKPVMFGEFGIKDHGAPDPKGINLHNSLWASFFGGCYGLSYWDTDPHLDANPKLYNHFKGLGLFLGSTDYSTYTKSKISDNPLVYKLSKGDETLLWVRSGEYYWGNRNPSNPSVGGLEINVGGNGAVKFYDTITGKEISETNFNSTLTIPSYFNNKGDAAIRINNS